MAEWAKAYQVFLPARDKKGVFWRPFKQGVEVQLKTKPFEPPKKLFFPPTEAIFSFSYDEWQISSQVPRDEKPFLLFGIRPCDLQGIKVIDQVFGQQDPYWIARIERTVLVSQPCTEAKDTCFCTWVGINPKEAKGADVSFIPLDGGWLFQPLTEKG